MTDSRFVILAAVAAGCWWIVNHALRERDFWWLVILGFAVGSLGPWFVSWLNDKWLDNGGSSQSDLSPCDRSESSQQGAWVGLSSVITCEAARPFTRNLSEDSWYRSDSEASNKPTRILVPDPERRGKWKYVESDVETTVIEEDGGELTPRLGPPTPPIPHVMEMMQAVRSKSKSKVLTPRSSAQRQVLRTTPVKVVPKVISPRNRRSHLSPRGKEVVQQQLQQLQQQEQQLQQQGQHQEQKEKEQPPLLPVHQEQKEQPPLLPVDEDPNVTCDTPPVASDVSNEELSSASLAAPSMLLAPAQVPVSRPVVVPPLPLQAMQPVRQASRLPLQLSPRSPLQLSPRSLELGRAVTQIPQVYPAHSSPTVRATHSSPRVAQTKSVRDKVLAFEAKFAADTMAPATMGRLPSKGSVHMTGRVVD